MSHFHYLIRKRHSLFRGGVKFCSVEYSADG